MSACSSVRRWLHRDPDALSESDRLVLEEHLQGCAACRDDRVRLRSIRDIASALPLRPLGPNGHAGAIAAALLGGSAAAVAQPRPTAWRAIAAIAAATALVVAVALVLRGRDGDRPLAVAPLELPSPREPVPPPVPPAPGVLELGEAEVRLADGALHRWDEASRTLHLDHGAVEVTLDSPAPARFRVETPRFAVDVTGTIFRVTLDGVTVSRGSVRITGRAGAVLVERLAAGESWTFVDEPTPPAAKSASAAESLKRARRAFDKGDVEAAARHAEAALASRPITETQVAAARTVLAECAQASGKLDDAIARYLEIADAHAGLPAAETALFAAARLAARQGDRAKAAALFGRYLDHYKDGRFADDARRRLEELP